MTSMYSSDVLPAFPHPSHVTFSQKTLTFPFSCDSICPRCSWQYWKNGFDGRFGSLRLRFCFFSDFILALGTWTTAHHSSNGESQAQVLVAIALHENVEAHKINDNNQREGRGEVNQRMLKYIINVTQLPCTHYGHLQTSEPVKYKHQLQ